MKRYDAARRSMALGMAVMMGVGGITGCGQKETKPAAETTKEVTEVSEQTAAETKTEAPEQAAPEEVVWWTYFGDANIGYLQTVIDRFNESQSEYHVTIEYQGKQDEMNAKIQSTAQKDFPALWKM